MNPRTGGYLEVDVWLPDISLCFEFQDDYHYKNSWYSHLPLSAVHNKDDTKRNQLHGMYQTLVSVPFWWDGTALSLTETIRFHRPDLIGDTFMLESVEPALLSANPPPAILPFDLDKKQLMLASFPEGSITAEDLWWVGEKWDGIRCYWNRNEKRLYSRQNAVLPYHPSEDQETPSLGHTVLDGELWCGRGSFFESQQLTLSLWDTLNTSYLRLVCFDEASQLELLPFERRYSLVLANLSIEHPSAIIAPRFLTSNEEDLTQYLQHVIGGGGEGLVLRKPLSLYTPGRSKDLLKIKWTNMDQEALVVNVDLDGSLSLQVPNGDTFVVPKEDCVLHRRAVRGDIVTFTLDNSARKRQYISQDEKEEQYTLSHPNVYRIRSDINWDDISANPPIKITHESHQNSNAKETNEQKRSWRLVSEKRAYFDHFAASKGMDSLNPVFWYKTRVRQLLQFHLGIRTIVQYYGGKLSTTLMNIYPDIGLQKRHFVKVHPNEWKHESARKAFFDQFAVTQGLDPLNPVVWYNVKIQDLTKHDFAYKHISSFYYDGRLSTTLMQLYPNIGLQPQLFKVGNNVLENR